MSRLWCKPSAKALRGATRDKSQFPALSTQQGLPLPYLPMRQT